MLALRPYACFVPLHSSAPRSVSGIVSCHVILTAFSNSLSVNDKVPLHDVGILSKSLIILYYCLFQGGISEVILFYVRFISLGTEVATFKEKAAHSA